MLVTYGYSFYSSSLWDLYDNDSKKLYITWNIAVRRLYDLPRTAHTRFLTHIVGVTHINLNLKCRFAKFLYKAINSHNERITFLAKLCMYNTMSITGSNVSNLHMLCEFNVHHGETYMCSMQQVINKRILFFLSAIVSSLSRRSPLHFFSFLSEPLFKSLVPYHIANVICYLARVDPLSPTIYPWWSVMGSVYNQHVNGLLLGYMVYHFTLEIINHKSANNQILFWSYLHNKKQNDDSVL